MAKGYVVVMLAAALMTGATGAQAQGAGQAQGKAKAAATQADQMAQHHRALLRLQGSAIKAADAAERLSRFKKMNQKAVEKQATRARDDLQAAMKHLDAADAIATPEEKTHVAEVRTHETEALKHAEELLAEAQKPAPEKAAISAHAKGVIEHARAARAVISQRHESVRKTGAGKADMGKKK